MTAAAPLLVVLVLDVAPATEAHAATRADVTHAITTDGRFALTPADDAKVAAVLADRAEATCSSDACALELGARHGADFVVRIEEARVAAEEVVALTALSVRTQKRAARASAQIADAARKREGVRALTRRVLDELAVSPLTAAPAEEDPRAWMWRGGFIGGGMAAIGVGIALEMLPPTTSEGAPEQALVGPVIIGGGLVAIGVGVVANPFES